MVTIDDESASVFAPPSGSASEVNRPVASPPVASNENVCACPPAAVPFGSWNDAIRPFCAKLVVQVSVTPLLGSPPGRLTVAMLPFASSVKVVTSLKGLVIWPPRSCSRSPSREAGPWETARQCREAGEVRRRALAAAASAMAPPPPRTRSPPKTSSGRDGPVRARDAAAMSAPRLLMKGATYLITRRCTQRQFLLRPSPETNRTFLYCLVYAAQQTGVEVHGLVAISNHWRGVVTDPPR